MCLDSYVPPVAPGIGLTPQQDYNSAKRMLQQLEKIIINFQQSIPKDCSVGIIFSGDSALILQDIFYMEPNIIMFSGVDFNGYSCRIVQHKTQLNLRLITVLPEEYSKNDKTKIGFHCGDD